MKDKDNPSRRLMLQAKNNLGEDTKGLAYFIKMINEVPTIDWEKQYVNITAEAAFASDNTNKASEVGDAVAWLAEVLLPARMKSDDLASLAKSEEFSGATLRRAKKKLGVVSVREGFGKEGIWWSELPKMLNSSIEAQAVE